MKRITPADSEEITQLCRWLRRNATPAEQVFWSLVRNRQFDGIKFFRQHPLVVEEESRERIFIADFYCRSERLVVEIDGGIHETQRDYDRLRTCLLNKEGIQVVRFSNDEVLHHPAKVKKQLEIMIQEKM